MDQRRVVDLVVLLVLLGLLVWMSYRYREPGVCTIDPVLEHIRRDMIKLEPRAAHLQWFPGDESYTEDKNKVFICLKDPEGKTYPYNDLVSVAVHELAHAFSSVIDKEHKTPEFNNLHAAYRKRAAALGLFDPTKQVPPTYCPKR
jgi:hypothetical protein